MPTVKYAENEYVEILVSLGLSLPQARIYFALSKMREGTNAAIAKASHLARQEVYRQMPILMELGLAEKIISVPSKYRATPIKNSITILIQRKTLEHAVLKKKAKRLLNLKNEPELPPEEPSQFLIACAKEVIVRRYRSEVDSAQVSLEAIGPNEANEHVIIDHCRAFEKKMKEGVRVRIITEKLRQNQEIKENLKILQKNPLFEIRELPNPPLVQLAIQDRKRVDIVVPYPQGRNMSDLWSNNISIVTLAVAYFDEMWSRAKSFTYDSN